MLCCVLTGVTGCGLALELEGALVESPFTGAEFWPVSAISGVSLDELSERTGAIVGLTHGTSLLVS